MNGDVNNDDRYSDYPHRLKIISGLPPEYISREIPPLRDVPHHADPRRSRSLQQVRDLERDRADNPLLLLDNQSGYLSDAEYRRRLRRVVVPPARARPTLRPLRLPNVRDPRRALACRRADHPDWALGPPTVVENELLPPPDEVTCTVLMIDHTDWPNESRFEVEEWPHECNVERARLDAQMLDGGESTMNADNADRDEVFECDEHGAAVSYYHTDVDRPMLGDDELLVDAVFDQAAEASTARERRLSGGEMTIRVKDERWLLRPVPAEDPENVDLVDLCSDDELDVKPKCEPQREGYREDVVREVLEVITLDDDDDDDIEITSVSVPRVLDTPSTSKESASRQQESDCLVQPEISISQRRLETNGADSDRNATPSARAQDDTEELDDRENRVDSETRNETECAESRPRYPSNIATDEATERTYPPLPPVASACNEVVPAYVCDYEHRSVTATACNRRNPISHVDNDVIDVAETREEEEARAMCNDSNATISMPPASTTPCAYADYELSNVTVCDRNMPISALENDEAEMLEEEETRAKSDDSNAELTSLSLPPVTTNPRACDNEHRSATTACNRCSPISRVNNDVEMREEEARATSDDSNTASALSLPPAPTTPPACSNYENRSVNVCNPGIPISDVEMREEEACAISDCSNAAPASELAVVSLPPPATTNPRACDYEHRSATTGCNRCSPISRVNNDAEMREEEARATSDCSNAAAPASELAVVSLPLAPTTPRACTDDDRTGGLSTVLRSGIFAAVPRRLELRFDGVGAAFGKQWSEPGGSVAAVWTGCEKRRERRSDESARRWRPYEGRIGGLPARRQQELERTLALLRDFFALAVNWSSISFYFGNHNLSLRCLLQAHANAKRSAEFWRARNDHWQNSKNHLSIKDVPQVENYDSFDNHDERSLCSYDGDVEEANDCEDLDLQEDHYKESYRSDSSLAVSRDESTSKNFNSDPSSSLQVNFNIKQNLFTSKVLKIDDSKLGRNSIKLKKRHSLPAVQKQYMFAKRSRSFSDESPKKGKTSSSLKLTLKRDHIGEYRISSQSVQADSKNFVKIVDVHSNGNCTSNNFTNRPTFAENKSLVKKNSDSTESTSKLKVHIDKAVPELELNDTRPVNMPVNRNNLENSLSTFLKSKVKRNSKDDAEVIESKRQKITDDSVAVNINVNITVNSLLESSVQKQKSLKLVSSNDNSKLLLPKARTNTISTSDFSSCNESGEESSICSKLNSKIGMPKNSHLNSVSETNTDPVKSPQEILQVDHNCNIEKQLSTPKKVSLENSEEEVKISEKSNTKHQQKISINGSLRLVFKNLFGEVSDASETEEEIYKKKRRKSSEYKKNQSASDIAASVEKSQSKSKTGVHCIASQDKSQLKDLNECSLKTAAIENEEQANCKTELSKEKLSDTNKHAEIPSIDSNVQFAKLLEENDLNKVSLNKNIPKQIHEFEKIHQSEETNSNTTDINILEQNKKLEKSCDTTISCSTDQSNPREIEEHQKSSGHKETNSNIKDQNIPPKQVPEDEKSFDNKKTNSHATHTKSPKQIDELKRSCDNEESISYLKDQHIPNQTVEFGKSCDSEEINSYIADENIANRIDECEKNGGSQETNFHIETKNIPERLDQFEKSCNSEKLVSSSEETNSCIIDEFSSKDQVMPDCSQTYDEVDLEGGDFEFMSSIHKIKNSNKYSDDEYNDYSDLDAEYAGSNNIEYSSDVELIENHEESPSNKDLRKAIDAKSDFSNTKMPTQESSIHNLNELPPFYNEDVTNFVKNDIIDDDDDIVILNELRPVSKTENNKNNFPANKTRKSKSIILKEIIDITEEITLEEMNEELPNEVINDNRETIPNNINIESTRSVTLTCEENGAPTKLILDVNEIPVSSDIESRNISEVTSVNTFINNLIENALQTSPDINEKSATPNKSVTDFSENILDSNSEAVFSNALFADDSEDILDVNRESVSPNALVIDETAGNDDSNIDSEQFTSELDKSISNEVINSESLENNLNSCKEKEVDELQSNHTSRFSGNVSNDLNNPNILKEFNLAREIVAPEEMKNEPVMSDDNNVEQQICENLLEEFKKNACNVQEQSALSIKVTEAPDILINQSSSNNVLSSNIVIEVTRENPEKLADRPSDWVDVDDLFKKGLKTTGTFKCRDINELLEKPVSKKTESNVVETSNIEVQKSTSSEIPSSTNNSNSTINMVQVQNNNSTNQINQQNNLIIGNNLIATNVPEPIYILSRPINQIQGTVNQLPALQVCIPQQIQPVLNTVNATLIPQYGPQTIILNSVQSNQNLSQGNLQTFTSAISNNVQSQNLPQGNPQTFTSAISNNIKSQNLSQGNAQTFTSAPSNNVQKIFASSMFTNMFAQKTPLTSVLPKSQTTMSNANFPNVVPKEHYTISTLPLPPSEAIFLPHPLSINPQENQTSVLNKVHTFRRILLRKIETELNFLRTIPAQNLNTYIEVLIQRKMLTEVVWNVHLSILNIMKCIVAISLTTVPPTDITYIIKVIINSLKPSETPQMQGTLKLDDVVKFNERLGKALGYRFNSDNIIDECASPVLLELQALQDQNLLGKSATLISEKQKQQFELQVLNYKYLFKTHQEQVNSLKSNYNVENLYQNRSLSIRPVNVATISNNSTTQSSLQKSLNDSKKKQSTLSTRNVTVQKNVDKAQTNNTDISVTSVESEKKEANTESILDNLNSSCLKCKKTSEIACSNCLSVAYCSRECQYKHWKENHHRTCESNLKGIKYL